MESSEDLDSLFEGMILIDPSSSSSSSSELQQQQPDIKSNSVIEQPQKSTPDPTLQQPQRQQQQQQPLDENLFSDLTLFSNPIAADDGNRFNDSNDSNHHDNGDDQEDDLIIPTPPPLSSFPTPTPPVRQTSRKKKRGAIRIGYGRAVSDPDSNSISKYSDSPTPQPPAAAVPSVKIPADSDAREIGSPIQHPSAPPTSHHVNLAADSHPSPVLPPEGKFVIEEEDLTKPRRISLDGDATIDVVDKIPVVEDSVLVSQPETAGQSKAENEEKQAAAEAATGSSFEVKLVSIRALISEKLEQIRERAAALSNARKETTRRRRKAAENVNLASAKYKDLEKQLEEACEAEDFEQAESVSESLAAAERKKEEFLNALREAEADCDSMDSEMQEVLELQIAAEEEEVMLLQQFAKDAADNADLVLSNAKELSSKETEEWLSSSEDLEIKRVELVIESLLVNEARSGLKDFIEHSVENDRKEQEHLYKKRDVLTEELDKLLDLVRLKEAEIAENTRSIEETERKITNVVSGFHEAQLSIDTKYDKLQSSISQIELESEALSLKEKEVDEFLSQTEEKKLKLQELASISANEAKACQEFIELRKNLAATFLNSRKDRARLAKTEEKISADVQILKQQISAARASLQELSSTRASIQQEIDSTKQRIIFIEKRGPELDAEKKVAAAARNFKEAGRIAAEAKALNTEKEDMQNKMERAILGLEKVEEEMKDTINKLQESEALILSKEKEVAIASCVRLRLVASAAMAERSAALKLGDLEEADILLAEAEAADLDATKLQQAYDVEAVEVGERDFISMGLIVNLGGKELAEMAASVQASAVKGSI